MRRLLPLVFLLACGPKYPPENAQRIARPREGCFERPKPPWDEVGPPAQNYSNLPRCPEKQLRDIDLTTAPEGGLLTHPFVLFGADAGRD